MSKQFQSMNYCLCFGGDQFSLSKIFISKHDYLESNFEWNNQLERKKCGTEISINNYCHWWHYPRIKSYQTAIAIEFKPTK